MEALRNKEGAAEALKQFAHKTALLGVLVSARDKAVLEVQTKHRTAIDATSAELTALKGQLQTWAEANPELFGEARSVEMGYGWLKFRKGQRKLVLLSKWTWDKVLEKLLSFPVTSQWQEYVRRSPDIDARKLLEATKDGGKLPETKLRDIGCRVIREESFSIETKPQMVANDCDIIP
jgi:hypothetical protein